MHKKTWHVVSVLRRRAISSKPMQVSPPNLQYPSSQQFYNLHIVLKFWSPWYHSSATMTSRFKKCFGVIFSRSLWKSDVKTCITALNPDFLFDLFYLVAWDDLDLYYGHKVQEMILTNVRAYCFDAATATGAPLVANRRTISYGRPPAVAHGPSVTLF